MLRRPRCLVIVSQFAVGLVVLTTAASAQVPAVPAHTPLILHAPVQDKNFYVLSLLETAGPARDAIKNDTALAGLASAKRDALAHAVESCTIDPQCFANSMKFSDEEIQSAAEALRAALGKSAALKQRIDGPLRRSGMYVRYHDRPSADLLVQAWTDAAHGINHVIDVYGLGHPGRSAAIDSIAYDVKSEGFKRIVRVIASVEFEDSAKLDLFFHPSLHFALELIEASRRNEAGRLEPLDLGENRGAVARIRTTTWSKYPYSVIVVPGAGPDDPKVSLSAGGRLRSMLAARRFHEGKAPFLLVSGGYVHPNQTSFSEAVEMKKALIAEFGVPASAILIDPHARHTTTNMRNAARQMYRYGIPFDKKALVTTDEYQSAYIEAPNFTDRCMKELGYLPYKLLGRISKHDLEFLPTIESLQLDAHDPLDP